MGMRGSWLSVALVLGVAVAAGCDKEGGGGPKAGGGGGGQQSSGGNGGGGGGAPQSPPTATRLWTQAEVEAWIREDLGLTEMSLTAGAAGRFTGTGKNAAGVPYKLTVTQRPGEVLLDHESPAPTAPGKMATGQIRFGGEKGK